MHISICYASVYCCIVLLMYVYVFNNMCGMRCFVNVLQSYKFFGPLRCAKTVFNSPGNRSTRLWCESPTDFTGGDLKPLGDPSLLLRLTPICGGVPATPPVAGQLIAACGLPTAASDPNRVVLHLAVLAEENCTVLTIADICMTCGRSVQHATWAVKATVPGAPSATSQNLMFRQHCPAAVVARRRMRASLRFELPTVPLAAFSMYPTRPGLRK